jgi:hypothetical protein
MTVVVKNNANSVRELTELTVVVSTPKWIDLRDVAPELGQHVVYYGPNFGAWTGRYNGRGKLGHKFSSFYGFSEGDVTHWFPMPARPERVRKNKR